MRKISALPLKTFRQCCRLVFAGGILLLGLIGCGGGNVNDGVLTPPDSLSEETNTDPITTPSPNNENVLRGEFLNVWEAFLAYRSIALNANSIDDFAGVITDEVYEEISALPEFFQTLFLDISQETEASDVIFLEGYMENDTAYLYVEYNPPVAQFEGADPPDPNGEVSVIHYTRENGQWRWNSANYGTDMAVPALWDTQVVEQIRLAASGTISLNGAQINVASAVGFYDSDEGEISIMFFPKMISTDELLLHRDTYFATKIMSDTPSPNPEIWPNWAPTVLITLRSDDNSFPSTSNIFTSCINYEWFTAQNEISTICSDEVRSSITQYTVGLGENRQLILTMNGNSTSTDNNYSWNIHTNINLLDVRHVFPKPFGG